MTPTSGAQIATRLLARSTLVPVPPYRFAPTRLGANSSTRRLFSLPRTNPQRPLHTQSTRKTQAAVAPPVDQYRTPTPDSTNPALSFPCLDAQEAKTAKLERRSHASGPEPCYTS